MIKDINALVEKIVTELRDYTDIAVIGLSGGVDSTLVATLCKRALGAENVYGIHMPYNFTDLVDDNKFNGNSTRIAKKLGIKDLMAPVKDVSDYINMSVQSAVSHLGLKDGNVVNSGNARSRARMCVLYGIAHELAFTLKDKRVRVIGTGNLSEDYIGYDTKGGDALADIFPIGELFKSEVYQLADYFVSTGELEDKMIDRQPSAGLWEGQTDEAELGYSYNEMEPFIRMMRDESGPILRTEIGKFVYYRHLANKHKHEAPPVIHNLRKFCD